MIIPNMTLPNIMLSSQYAKIITFKVGLFSAERLVSVAICSSANEKPTTKRTELNVDEEYKNAVSDIEHLDMNAVNKIFEYINKTIHASYE